MIRKLFYVLMAVVFVFANAASAFAQQGDPDRFAGRELPASVQDLKMDSPAQGEGIVGSALHSALLGGSGPRQVIVRLSADSGAEAFAKGADTAAAVRAARAQQNAFLNTVRALDPNARLIARVQTVLNAVFVEVDASALATLAQDPRVERIAPVANYEMDLSETVPYIGASAVQAAGYDGSGIKVAVLDSGIDYHHAALGGSGNPADYAANDPTIIEPGSFPTAKVVNGYDFVGSSWLGSGGPPEAPDPDPLDDGPGAGHGTHVGHIIGGTGGVAPGVDLYAVKVCSSISTACSGIALIQGMDFAADPNGDGYYMDRVDLINMSLGSQYGQPFDDDLSAAVDSATGLGILTVASAGNSADKPYATGTPAAADSALSVAQTEVPSAGLQFLNVDSVNYPAIFQPWSAPLVSTIGPVPVRNGASYGSATGCSTDITGESELPADRPYPAGTFSGEIVLVNRGGCTFTAKIRNIEFGGGAAGVIGLVAPGAPFSGGFGGGTNPTIPGYMISQAHSNAIKAAITAGPGIGELNPANQLPLVGVMVGGSSRGPQHENTTYIKPEIGAPGASVSAIAGTGTDEGPFGGTSGAAPMVTGSAALLLDAYGGSKATPFGTPPGNALGHGLAPIEVKSLLMNNADPDILNDVLTGEPAPISRIGGGEVRVDQALSAAVAAWDRDVPTGGLGFGFVDVADTVALTKTVQIRNLDNKHHTYTITPTFRYANDAASGAVSVSAPASVVVKPGKGKFTYFDVSLTIDGSLLPGNYMNSGSQGANPATLTLNEYDGYLLLDDGSHSFQIPWHVLPRKAAHVTPDTTTILPGSFPQVIGLDNSGVGTAQNDAYSLIAVSPDIPEGGLGGQSPTPDLRAVGINTFPVPAGFCSGSPSFVWAFAINTWERQEHLVPVNHNVYLDTNQDSVYDYAVYNFDLSLSGSLSDGRQVTWAQNLTTNAASAFFFAEHSTNTGNTVLLICAEQVGMSGADLLATNVDIAVEAFDWYYGGPGDFITGLTVTPLGEQYFGLPSDVAGNTYDPSGLEVYDFGPFPGNTAELGLLLFTNGDRGTGARGGATQETEALLFFTP